MRFLHVRSPPVRHTNLLITTSVETIIEAPREQVYCWLTNQELQPVWLPHMIQNTRDGAELAPGVCFRQVFRAGWLRVASEGKVLDAKEPEALELELTQSGSVTHCHYRLSERSETQTQICQSIEIRPGSFIRILYAIAKSPVRWLARRQATKNLQSLKRVCESNDVPPTGN